MCSKRQHTRSSSFSENKFLANACWSATEAEIGAPERATGNLDPTAQLQESRQKPNESF